MRSRSKITGRSEYQRHIQIPHCCLKSPNWSRLSGNAVKLFIDIYGEYYGTNNGDLCAAWTMMKPLGWRSKATLHKALHELMYYGWLEIVRHGGRRKSTLYAISFKRIDFCDGKLDVHAPQPPTRKWADIVTEPFVLKKLPGTTWREKGKPTVMGETAVIIPYPPKPLFLAQPAVHISLAA